MNNSLQIRGTQSFMGKDIPVVLGGFGPDKRCICDKTIAEIHGMEAKNIRSRITENIKHMRENVDYIDIKIVAYQASNFTICSQLGYSKMEISKAEHLYLLSERGYQKLIKIMDTDKAWEIYEKLLDEYFELNEIVACMLSKKDVFYLKIIHAGDEQDTAKAIAEFDNSYIKPLETEVDRLKRFIGEDLQTITKTQLAQRLDTSTQALASLFKKMGVYTPKGCQPAASFIKSYPNVKMIQDTITTYETPSGTKVEQHDWQWTKEGALKIIELLIKEGHVVLCDNAGYKLVKTA